MAVQPEVSPVVKAMIAQLLKYAALIAAHDGQVEVRLIANKGRLRGEPTIVLNGGPQQMVDPE